MMGFTRKRLQGSSCLALCFLIAIAPSVGAGHDGQVPLSPLVEGDHHNFVSWSGFSIVKRAASELFCDLQRIFGWCQDHGKESKQPQNDNTNPDEPNPKVLIRVPRQKRHGSGHSHKYGGGKRRNRSRVAHLDKRPQRRRFSKMGSSISVSQLKNRRFGGRGGRKSKRVVVNGKWYGPKRRRNGNSTEPRPRPIDHLAHLRKPLTPAALEKQQRRFVTNKAYLYRKAKKERARRGNKRMAKLMKQMEEQKKKNQAAKEEEFFDSYSFASSSSFSFFDGGSASADAAYYDSSTDEVIEDNFNQSYSDEDEYHVTVKKRKRPKRPPSRPKFARHKHKHSHSHSHGGHSHGRRSHGHAHGNNHGYKKGRRMWSKKFRSFKMTSRGRR